MANEGIKKSRVNVVDVFFIVVLIVLLLGAASRVIIGRLSGPDYTTRAVADFTVESDSEVFSGMKAKDELLLADSGAVFGTINEVRHLAEGTKSGKASGTVNLLGADTEAGFLLPDGVYLIPGESYRVTNGQYTVTMQISKLLLKD